jgi:bifunctional non-homologous end joining protein LigD
LTQPWQLKEICDEINIPCYCKTSGATGLHIYIPLAGKYTYSQVKTFAELMAVITHHRLPDFTSIERSTVKRKDKIYIDFLQNRKGQTIAAPYSVRPRPLATVSTPLKWKEVNQSLSPELFTIQNIHQRLESNGDIWQPVLKKGVLLNKALESIEKLS